MIKWRIIMSWRGGEDVLLPLKEAEPMGLVGKVHHVELIIWAKGHFGGAHHVCVTLVGSYSEQLWFALKLNNDQKNPEIQQ